MLYTNTFVMGLFDFLKKKKYEYTIQGSKVEELGVEFNFPEECDLTSEGVFVLKMKQTKKERAEFEDYADANQEFAKDLPRYTFKCPKCNTLFLITDLKNFHLLKPTEIITVCKDCS